MARYAVDLNAFVNIEGIEARNQEEAERKARDFFDLRTCEGTVNGVTWYVTLDDSGSYAESLGDDDGEDEEEEED